MPAAAPPISIELANVLATASVRLRMHRKRLGVSAVTAAEAAGISRVTLHRIERGEPSVAMGSYVSAAAAVGLELRFVDPKAEPPTGTEPSAALPPSIHVADYPQLARLAWQLPATADITPREALELYERNWRHVDRSALSAPEQALLEALAHRLGGGMAMALRYGEYRESVDIYLLISDLAGYRALRQVLMDALGVQAIARSGATLIAAREVRADQ